MNIIIIVSLFILHTIIHEFGHFLAGILLHFKINYFAIGFGKPYLKFYLFKKEFRLSPWLLGAGIDFDEFFEYKYFKKVIVLLSGIILNFIVAVVCGLILFKDLSITLYAYWMFLIGLFTGKFDANIFRDIYNIYLFWFGFVNFTAVIFSILPIPPLDGGLIWVCLLKNKYPDNFKSVVKKSINIGYVIMGIITIIAILYMYIL